MPAIDWFIGIAHDLWANPIYRLLVILALVEVLVVCALIVVLTVRSLRINHTDRHRRELVGALRESASDESNLRAWIDSGRKKPQTSVREALLELGLTEDCHIVAKKAWGELGFADAQRNLLLTGTTRQRLKAVRRVFVFPHAEDEPVLRSAAEAEEDPRFGVTAAQVLAKLDSGRGVFEALLGLTLERRIMEQPYYWIFHTLSTEELQVLLNCDVEQLHQGIQRVLLEVAAQRRVGDLSSTLESWVTSKELERQLGCARIATAMDDEWGRQLLRKLLLHDAWQVRAQAIRGLGETGTAEDLRGVADALEDPEFWVQDNATWALIRLANRGHSLPNDPAVGPLTETPEFEAMET